MALIHAAWTATGLRCWPNWRRYSTARAACTAMVFGLGAALLSGCGAPAVPEPTTLLVVSPDAASGPDFVADGNIDRPGADEVFQLDLKQSFNSVVVMSAGATDTAVQVEMKRHVPITAECEGDPWKAAQPCVWGHDDDVDTPNPLRTAEFNSMPASLNFLWEGSLAAGTYFIRVTGQRGATGAFRLTVELNNQDCPDYYCDL